MKLAKRLALVVAPLAVAFLLTGISPASAKVRHQPGSHSHQIQLRGKAKGSQDARQLFSAKNLPADLPASSVGSYSNGCLCGAEKMPKDGPHWQVMHRSRNRFWGRQELVDYLKSLSELAHKHGWEGLLIGDMSMPRGGPMPSGHASHQIGLDVDVWLRQAPPTPLGDDQRETMDAPSILQLDSEKLDPNVWTPEHAALVKDAAQDPNVARIFVTPAIKQYLCDRKDKNGADTEWLRRLRPCGLGACDGHDDHIHVRLHCPKGDNACNEQQAPDPGDGCGSEVADALNAVAKNPPYSSRVQPVTPRASFPLSSMPKACIGVLNAPDKVTP